uniref:Zf-C2HC5 domain-containing protein n=1 Tax=Dracunculus medinensis TaxID=318479 RepID=A0A0N4U355_DRAME
LIRNCMSCGRVVCEQEGSGPCWFCGELVCTRDERKVLEDGSKNSLILRSKFDRAIFSSASGSSDATIQNDLEAAKDLRNRLLEADADVDRRTRVHDLQSDYHNLENNIYLTKEEREAIIARKQEIKEFRARQKKLVALTLERENIKFQETHMNDADDPVIQSIMERSMNRVKQITDQNNPTFMSPNSFIAKYDETIGRKIKNIDYENIYDLEDSNFYLLNDQMMYAYVERKGFAIALYQPVASFLVHGKRKHIPWHDEVHLRGPLIIVSNTQKMTDEIFDHEISMCKAQTENFESDFPCGAILGRAFLDEVLSPAEYADVYPGDECCEVKNGFILIFKFFEPLLIPIPHIPSRSDIYKINNHLKNAVQDILLSQ